MSSKISDTLNNQLDTKLKSASSAIKDYLENGTDNAVSTLNRYLQVLSYTIDYTIFDPHTPYAIEFFINLYELMKKSNPRSQFAWCGVEVLNNICHNAAARVALVNTYEFLPSLARMLSDNLILDKKIKLLRVIQSLTWGIKISWQIPQLQHLINTLSLWIESPNETITALSLGILANLCYKNLPAIYTLTSSVDIKKLLRSITSTGDSIIEVHALRLLIIIEKINGDMEFLDLPNLFANTFRSVKQAFLKKDAIVLQQTVEFVIDVCQNERRENKSYCFVKENNIAELIMLLENSFREKKPPSDGEVTDPNCVAALFEFIHFLLEINKDSFQSFYPKLINCCIEWIESENVSVYTLGILRTIALSTPSDKRSLLRPLVTNMPLFLLNLESSPDEETPTNLSYNRKMTALVQLIAAMIKVDRKIVLELKQEMIMKIFHPLINNDKLRQKAPNIDTCSEECISLYIMAIALVNDLVQYDIGWQTLQEMLFEQKQVHFMLSQAMIKSKKEIKELIFDMSILPNFPKNSISSIMSSMQTFGALDAQKHKEIDYSLEMHFPVLSHLQNERLEQLLSKLKEALDDRNMMSPSMSDVMELYEYKLASMSHAEKVSTASVEAASEQCTQLKQQLSHITAEYNRLHQLLFQAQNRFEQENAKKNQLQKVEHELREYIENERQQKKALQDQYKAKDCELINCKLKLEEKSKKLQTVTEAKDALEEQHNKLKHLISKLEENCTKLEKNLQKKEDTLKKSNVQIEKLKMELSNKEESLVQMEEKMQIKSKNLEDTLKELEEKRIFIETIQKMAAQHRSK